MSDPKITRVVSSVGTTRTLEMDDGSIVARSGGTVSWRNNNPGNLKFEFAGSADTTVHNPRTREQALDAAQNRYQGVVGLDQWGNAVFESYEAGRAAKNQLLERRFAEKTVEEMLPSYSTADYSGKTHHKEQAAAIFAEGDRHGVDLREKTVGQMSVREREVLADGIRRFEGWRAGEVETIQQPSHTPTTVPVQTQSPSAQPGSTPVAGQSAAAASGAAVYNEAYQHFLGGSQKYEYGRPDHPRPGRDSSRLERDADGDGRRGVDCSAFVWRGLKNAGYDVPGENAAAFTTAKLFSGTNITPYAREHFEVTSAAEARKPNGSLHQGDILMFSSSQGQHVGIFKGYDSKGNIQFIGSQGSTGPAEVTITPGGYWDGSGTRIVGALTPKPEFQVRAPLHGATEPSAARTQTPANVSPIHQGSSDTASHHMLKRGIRGDEVQSLQQDLNRLGVRDTQGNRLAEDGRFGDNTREAVMAFQKQHGLQQDGVVGRDTRAALSAPMAKAADDPAAAPKGPSLNDASHPDHALHNAIRSKLPSMISNEAAANVTLQAKQNGIDSADKLQNVTVQDGKAFVMGTTPGFRAAVDLNQPAPSLEQTSAQLLAGQSPQQQAHDEQQRVAIGGR
ncbi:peptidoglycan-binding protein [Xanthomonas vesicatoria ATCC 35937]|uniref:C40 family peptidase n=1 Tax=Xanthomonas vesicatoria TaxID=56460 RepID=UPI00031ECFE7|nr:peptidoglycan-binding protein [Xanthomonas vesicatoria]APP76315.1 peptidoglycan-binding protein [Xanthomonas vesicatoria ATCC 35937]KTF30589.1 peptidoglycan-binding protein [Xanthomonas vesicatoria]MCC8598897.1 peptidoglycan-binding protein [Xanthomonas vesicatoria]MCC8606903.1 peptidoglycan-binding protein [Xanthomonas vesicatoria]